jgi:hypothetical protein
MCWNRFWHCRNLTIALLTVSGDRLRREGTLRFGPATVRHPAGDWTAIAPYPFISAPLINGVALISRDNGLK